MSEGAENVRRTGPVSKPGLQDVLPLSPLQEGLLFHALYDTDGADVYTVQTSLDLDGDLENPRKDGAPRRSCPYDARFQPKPMRAAIAGAFTTARSR